MDSSEDAAEKKVLVGICAMAKKYHSNSMKEIIKRLENFTRLQIVIFEEQVILQRPVEEWPVVNAFISFFSSGFPLDKAIAYKNLRQPFVVNDLEMQMILQDRTEVYRILEENNIPHPRYTVLNREKDPNCQVEETDDSIKINEQLYVKPFVEKPISAEDHNIYIYFPQAAGGGSTRLFRKVKDRSSVYSHTSNVRTNGAYLYEDFMPTDGTDVKIYTVGSDYQHAEARKSPCLDGKVERDANGKEVRYPILLSAREKVISRKVVWAFGQNVCGFDLLRASGKCYVCDVNGFSFVKTSNKYYDDCARILGTLMLRAVCPTLHIPYPLGPAPEDDPVVPTTSGQMMELRCVVALVRHGERTPKQKLKMEVKNRLFFELFERHGGLKKNYLKLKHPNQLQEALDIVHHLLDNDLVTSDADLQDKKSKLQQIKVVLEIRGQDRQKRGRLEERQTLLTSTLGMHNPQCHRSETPKRRRSKDGSSPREESGKGKHQKNSSGQSGRHTPTASDGKGDKEARQEPSLLLILKWGGELTPAGKIQAENLGKAFRTLYPGGQGQFEAPGLGFLRLHSTFRHDLKIYSSDEGRVQMTAAAFTKGLLALEGELTPIVVQMVKSSNMEGMLDGESKACKSQMAVKERLQTVFNQDHDFTEVDFTKLNPTNTLALTNAMVFVKNPKAMCRQVFQMIKAITAKIRMLRSKRHTKDLQLYNGESWELLIRRWSKLEKDFPLRNGDFQINKIPDIYDCIKHDLQHNQQTLQYDRSQELFMCSKALADLIIPQEYGITVEEKLHIAQDYCSLFLCKIRIDFQQTLSSKSEDSTTRLDSRYSKGVLSPGRFVRTRLYFSSESHIHSVMNILRYGNFIDASRPVPDHQWERALNFLDATAEFNYMSQVVFMMYEDASKDKISDERYHMELHFSPGAYTSCDEPSQSRGMGFRPRHMYAASAIDQATHPLELDDDTHTTPTTPTTSQVTHPFELGDDIPTTSNISSVLAQPFISKMAVFTDDDSALSPKSRQSIVDLPNLRVDGESQRLAGCSCPLAFLGDKLFHSVDVIDNDSALQYSLEGFHYVPQLHPLETLHNTLTFHEVNEFLNRITTVKFPSPEVSTTALPDNMLATTPGPSQYSGKKAQVWGAAHMPSFPASGSYSMIEPVPNQNAPRLFMENPRNDEGNPESMPGQAQGGRCSNVAKVLSSPPPVEYENPNATTTTPHRRACYDSSMEYITNEMRNQSPQFGSTKEREKPKKSEGPAVASGMSYNRAKLLASKASSWSVDEDYSGNQK
ncbi:hypothetical protein ACOMHN_038205 [Nucella lapillus]